MGQLNRKQVDQGKESDMSSETQWEGMGLEEPGMSRLSRVAEGTQRSLQNAAELFDSSAGVRRSVPRRQDVGLAARPCVRCRRGPT